MNLEELSNEELMAMAGLTPDPQPVKVAGPGVPSAAPDVSELSTEELLASLKGVQGFDTGRFRIDPVEGQRPDMEAGMAKAAEKRAQKGKRPGKAESALYGLTDWMGMGWADELAGGLQTGVDAVLGELGDDDLATRYKRRKAAYEQHSQEAWDDHPWAYSAGALPGFGASMAITPGLRLGKAGITAASRVAGTAAERAAAMKAASHMAAVKSGAGTGALYGGISGAGQGDEFTERLGNAGIGAVLGGGAGAVLGKVGAKASDWITERAVQKAAEEGVQTAAQRQADPFGVPLTRGQALDDVAIQTTENAMSGGAYGDDAQRIASASKDAQHAAIRDASDDIGTQLAGQNTKLANPEDAGRLLKTSIEDTAEAERTSLAAADANMLARELAARQAIESNIAKNAPVADDFTLGETVSKGLSDRAEVSGNVRDAAYDAARQIPAQIRREGVEDFGQKVRQRLAPEVIVNKDTTNSVDMLNRIDAMGRLEEPNNLAAPGTKPAPQSIVAVDAAGIESMRKQIVKLEKAAYDAGKKSGSFTDYEAARAIGDAFDEQLEEVFRRKLFDGDDRWLDAYKHARGLHAEHRKTFSPDGDLKRAMRDIVDSDANPQQVADYIFGRSQVPGDTRIARDLVTHLGETLGRDSDEFAAIKQRGWQKLVDIKGGVTHDTAQKVAEKIENFLSKRGRATAEALYDPGERAIMAKYAQDLRNMATTRRTSTPELEAMLKLASKEKPLQVTELVDKIVGGGGKAGRNGNSGRLVETLEAVFGKDSEEWSAARQMVWKHITGNADFATPKGAQKLSENILDLVGGKGSPYAEKLFTTDELQKFSEYARVLKRVVGNPDAKNPPNSGNRAVGLARKYSAMILSMLTAATGDLVTAGVVYGTSKGAGIAKDKFHGARASRLFSGARDISASGAIKDKGSQALLGTSAKGRKASGPAAGAISFRAESAIAGEDEEGGDAPPLKLRIGR